ncbi:DoxX family protein [Dongia deserti]|uniref:DoxX family protein n=1 Tax=Dongia deserti TaxID=2268030 RepID=UPI000E65E7F4|nr:DoxX family protein [Dongia deserti]
MAAITEIAETATEWAPRVRSILRIMTGLLFLQHGTSKYLGFPQSQMTGVDPTSLGGIAGMFELVGGTLIVIGLFTRPVAFVLSGLMAAAYWIAHAPSGFFPLLNEGELAALYCFVFLYFAFIGAGPWSVDAARGKA